MPLIRLLPPLLTLLAASAASGVIIDSGDGSGNTSAPAADPGWSHVGQRGGGTAVYLDNGWMITANHVGAGTVWLDGLSYSAIPGTEVEVQNGDGSTADLELFAVTPQPPLPALPIASSAPSNGTELVLIGQGRNRGSAISCDPNGPPPPGPIDGYDWASGRTLRWGTNHVERFDTISLGSFITESFGSHFDAGGSDHEAQAATGDSGGAAFAWNGSQWELVGILIAIDIVVGCQENASGQDPSSSLYGQSSFAADLSQYRQPILDVISMPEPSGGVAAGGLLVALLSRRTRPTRSPERGRRALTRDQ